MDEDDISRTIEEELREHESKGHIRRLGWEEMLEKAKGRRKEGWVVFAVPIILPAQLALMEIENTYYPPNTEANAGFELLAFLDHRDYHRSFSIALCKPFDGCREEFERILRKHGSIPVHVSFRGTPGGDAK